MTAADQSPADLTAEIDFDDLRPVEVPVRVAGARYLLREASGDAAIRYRNAISRAARMEGDKVTGIGDLADAEAILVAGCLFAYANPQAAEPLRQHVPVDVVRSWPDRVQSALFERAKAISPTLHDKAETVESVDRQIDRLQRRRLELLAAGNGHPPAPGDFDPKG